MTEKKITIVPFDMKYLEDYYNNCKVAGSQSVGLLEPLLKEIPNE